MTKINLFQLFNIKVKIFILCFFCIRHQGNARKSFAAQFTYVIIMLTIIIVETKNASFKNAKNKDVIKGVDIRCRLEFFGHTITVPGCFVSDSFRNPYKYSKKYKL